MRKPKLILSDSNDSYILKCRSVEIDLVGNKLQCNIRGTNQPNRFIYKNMNEYNSIDAILKLGNGNCFELKDCYITSYSNYIINISKIKIV